MSENILIRDLPSLKGKYLIPDRIQEDENINFVKLGNAKIPIACGYTYMFRPTLKEVLTVAPEEAVAFKIKRVRCDALYPVNNLSFPARVTFYGLKEDRNKEQN